MNAAEIYLTCFIVGFALTMFSLLVGVFHIDLPGNWDNFLHGHHTLGHFHGPMGHGPHGHLGHGGHGAHGGGHHADAQVSPFNFSTLMAFLTWFGGAGYVLTQNTRLVGWLTLGIAVLAGKIGAAVVFFYLTRFLLKHDHSVYPSDFDLVGTVGTLNGTVGGTRYGELLYTGDGTRKSIPARSEDGAEIGSGEEVAVTRYEDGVAYVRRWQDLTGEGEEQPG
ncbi:MAG: NfeD family protein [Acidobacteriales bacterium]|nr:NfeD family protein [Terriglobales bacterium]